ncbi:TonB-dependent receptor [Fulvivirgaceae bacterium PWU5]|uniref:TonB-dependent receptor n=1 Tax=Dawidia cretensis TaxID=2782350 RepID=A0AAP2E482_9BACT|nr:TonB-dependent receptor [Dawidia cretensis]MBT1711894.1 TonB-dependent receptor [Dawidia cretensis]
MKANLLALLMMLSLVGYGQSPVGGRVVDENDQPLPGVNVLIKGTTLGTVTDAGGEFRIDNAPADATLQISFIGYTSQEVTVGTKTMVTVKLLPDLTNLDEIVVVGYGTTTQKELTGSVSVVNGKDLAALNPQRIEQALQGQVAGVQISAVSGSPGGSLNIRIRGLSTNGDNAPLILVDGVPYSDDGLAALNPSDVESINVLKDATAAIYGVRAANGVIIITTKQGKRNAKPVLEFGGYYGIQQTSRKLDLLNANEFGVLKNEAYASGGQTPPYANPSMGRGTNWQKEVFQSAPIQNYNLSMTGGSEKSSYSIGGSYLDQEGIVGGDKSGYRRYNARINFTTELAPRITLQSVLLYTNERRSTLNENGISSVLFNTINANPASAPFNPDGTYAYLEDVSEVINPLAQIANTFNRTRVNKLVGKQELTYKINDHFELSGRAGYNYAIVDEKIFNPLTYYGAGKAMNTALNENLDPNMRELADSVFVPVYSNVEQKRTTYFNYNLEAFVNYNRTFNGIHKVKATLGTSIFAEVSEGLTGTGYNVPYDSWEFADISATEAANFLNNTSSSQARSRMQSFFARAEYGYGSKYLVSAILRRDASTRFGKNYRFGYFPSISAAWVASEESFFQVDQIQFLKVRASYGVSGNDRIGDYKYRSLLDGEGVYPFNDLLGNGVAVGTISNPDLKWETTEQANFGIDMGLFNDKLSVTMDYYIKTTRDLLFQPDISAIVGGYGAGSRPPVVNAGDVRNRGLELHIDYRTQLTKDVSVSVGYNLTTIHNEVISMPVEFLESGNFSVGGETATRMQVGYPIGYFFGYKTDGIYQNAEEIAGRGITQPGANPGDLRFVDSDKSGTITFGDDGDKTMIGSPIPDVIMGLNLGVNFKGIDLSGMFYASLGNEILRNYERQVPLSNQLRYNLGRWTGAGSTNEYPRLTTAASNNGVISDFFVEDGSFLRLKNVQLGYTLPAGVVNRIGATRLRVYVAANNLFTLTKYQGYDPDFSTDNPLTSGIDYGFYPQAKTFMAGLNLNF